MGEAAGATGGILNRTIGSSVTVLFGPDGSALEASRGALFAAGELAAHLEALQLELQQALGCRTEHAIHLHAGAAAVGSMDRRTIPIFAVEGGVIDIARRLAAYEQRRAMSRAPGRLLASRAACVAAELDLQYLEWREMILPGGARIEMARID